MDKQTRHFNDLLSEARYRLENVVYDPREGVTPGEVVLGDMQDEGLCTAEEARYMKPCLAGRWFE